MLDHVPPVDARKERDRKLFGRARVRPWRYLLRRLLRPRIVVIDGLRMIVDPERMDIRTVKALYHGDYEAGERIITKLVLEPGDRVLEAGAGIGMISMTAARIVGEKNIVAYEPMPLACAILDENMRLNGLSIDWRERALGTKPARRQFLAQPNILSSSWIPRDGGQMIEIAVDHVADVLAETRANVLILDAEGAEVEIIEGCPLDQIDKVVVEMHGNLVGPEAIARIADRLVASGLIPYDELCRGRVMTFLRKPRA